MTVMSPGDVAGQGYLVNLGLYTAITRGRKLVVLVGSWKAVSMAVKRVQSKGRITLLKERLDQPEIFSQVH